MDNSCKTPRWRLLKAQLNNLTPRDFHQRIRTGRTPLVVDVRTASEFASGHIEGALHIDFFAEDFWDCIEALDPQRDILVYCRTGRRSIRACTLMRNGGFDNAKVFNLEGGFVAWRTAFTH
ncbi:MAG: rhodanese-like domain-containing protein [Bacteroidota bacterium]